MSLFAGFRMPLWYEKTGIIAEHNAVRNSVGIFDITHMGRFKVTGLESRRFLNHLVTNDLTRVPSGLSEYALLCNYKGGVLDDLFVYRLDKHEFYVVVNASNREKDFNWFMDHVKKYDATMENISDYTPMFAVQGPNAVSVLNKLSETRLDEIPRFGVNTTKLGGSAVLISRTGYTGEDGFEVCQFNVPKNETNKAVKLFEAILSAGAEYGILPCGLGCRDTLRLEAGYSLYGQDLDEQTTPLEASLRIFVKLKKKSFIGRRALLRQKRKGVKRIRIGLSLLDKGIPRAGYDILRGIRVIGKVTSGSFSPVLQKGIGVGYVERKYAEKGAVLAVRIRERLVKAEVIKMPNSFLPKKPQ
jgi:aminomethyltransferase